MNTLTIRNCLWAAVSISIALFSANASAQARKPIAADKARVVEHWTKERRAAAIPRDLVIDERGLGYLRHPDGSLRPYGHDVAALEAARAHTPSPFAKPGGGSGDTAGPTYTKMDPDVGATIGASYTFKATVADPSDVKSVSFKIKRGSSLTQSFSATRTPNTNDWSVQLSGFTDGAWSWWIVAKDNAAGGGNSSTSATVNFNVSTGSGGGGTGTITSSPWTGGGAVQNAAGRIYFEMPSNSKRTRWSGYVCSGTVATDGANNNGRSIIVTAAHCVYDDANKAFARNVLFIPNQAGTIQLGGTGTDLNCANDPLGCWVPSFGVVDTNWTTRTFPDNVEWDYAFYVVSDIDAHSITDRDGTTDGALDQAAGSFPVWFGTPSTSADVEYALGYSYSEDPKFMYCAENMMASAPGTNGSVNWWLASCELSGGSSGGPWVQPGTASWNGDGGNIISVNSWGYTNSPGMAGPKLGPAAERAFCHAKKSAFFSAADGNAGIVVSTPCP